MTDLWTCTDCDTEIPQEDRKAHMRDEHGVNHTLPDEVCHVCGAIPCKRINEMMGEPA